MIGYQIEGLAHSCLAENIFVQSNMYPRFIGKVSTLAHFPLELRYEDDVFLDQSFKESEHGLDSFLTNSIKTLVLAASFNESDVITSLVSSRFLCLVSTSLITLNHSCSKLQNYGAKLGVLLLPVLLMEGNVSF